MRYILLICFSVFFSACGGSGEDAQSNFIGGVTSMSISGFSASLNQNSSANSFVGQVNIDSQGNPAITHFELFGINANYFNIDQSGVVQVSSSARLDATIKDTYTLEAIAYNGKYESNRANIQISLINTDLPEIENFSASVNENNASGSFVGTINITRIGASPITAISLSGADSSHFSVATDGTITIASGITLEYDSRSLYSLTSIARNSDGDSHAKDVIITVNEVSTVANPNYTQVPLLLILVDTDDYPIGDTDENWHNKAFGTSYGQINHYFLEVSNGTYGITPVKESYGTVDDGVVKVSFGANHPNVSYPNSPYPEKYFGGSTNIQAMILEAETVANIDFAQYDENNNSTIEADELQVMLLIGGGELASSVGPGVWAHAGGINLTVDGVSLSGYSMFGEMQGSNSNRHFATIGVIAHELGHAMLDLPDLYSRPGGSGKGIGGWGLMASGSWSYKRGEKQGETPIHMCGWSKVEAGFQTPTVVASGSTNNIEMIATHLQTSNIIKIPIPGSTEEYFLAENRSPVGYDEGLYFLEYRDFEGGISIMHVDEDKNNYNEQNDDASHKLVDIEEADADGSMDAGTDNGQRTNLYYAGNRTTFNDSTTPNSRNYAGASTNVSVSNVSVVGDAGSDYVMYLDVAR